MKLFTSLEAQKGHRAMGGTYILQEDMTNNKPYWIHQSGEKAIWWDDKVTHPCWKAGNFKDLGSSKGSIFGPSNNDSAPNQITNGWQYTAKDGFHDTNDVRFEDWTFKQGRFLQLLCKNLF